MNSLEDGLGLDSPFSTYLGEWALPLTTLLYNFVIVPLLITKETEYEDHDTDSGQQKSIMWKFYLFLSLNVFFLPLAGLFTIIELFDQLLANDV